MEAWACSMSRYVLSLFSSVHFLKLPLILSSATNWSMKSSTSTMYSEKHSCPTRDSYHTMTLTSSLYFVTIIAPMVQILPTNTKQWYKLLLDDQVLMSPATENSGIYSSLRLICFPNASGGLNCFLEILLPKNDWITFKYPSKITLCSLKGLLYPNWLLFIL